MSNEPEIPSITKSVLVRRDSAWAFEVFTREFGQWWPYKIASVGLENNVAEVVMEPRLGGAIYEVWRDGSRKPWGRITGWDPPRQLNIDWHPERDVSQATQLTLRFVEIPGGTKVELIHDRWPAYGPQAAKHREDYNGGWELVFVQSYGGYANGSLPPSRGV